MEFTLKDFQAGCGIIILFAIIYLAIFVLYDKAKEDPFFKRPVSSVKKADAEPS